jgi:hypothetical protein
MSVGQNFRHALLVGQNSSHPPVVIPKLQPWVQKHSLCFLQLLLLVRSKMYINFLLKIPFTKIPSIFNLVISKNILNMLKLGHILYLGQVKKIPGFSSAPTLGNSHRICIFFYSSNQRAHKTF